MMTMMDDLLLTTMHENHNVSNQAVFSGPGGGPQAQLSV